MYLYAVEPKNTRSFSDLSDYDVLKLSEGNFQDLVNDVVFWRDRALAKGYIQEKENFGDTEKWPDCKASERYLQLLSKKDCIPGSEKYIKDWKEIYFRAGKKGDIKLINYFLDKDATYFNVALWGAAEGGHLDPIKYLIEEKGATLSDMALDYAAKGGHLEIVKYLIEKGASVNSALYGATSGGHLDLIKYLIDEKGATHFNNALYYAALIGKNMEIVKYLIAKGATDINPALVGAVRGGHIDIVKYLIAKGPTNFNSALIHAAETGYIDVVKYLIEEKGATKLNEALDEAANKRHLEIVKYLIEKGATNFYNFFFIEKIVKNKYILDSISLYNSIKSKNIIKFTSLSKNLNNTQIIDVLIHYVKNYENINNLLEIISAEQLYSLITNLHKNILKKIEKNPDSATNIRKLINTSLNIKGPDSKLIEIKNQLFYSSGRPKTSMSFLLDIKNFSELPEAQIITAKRDNLLIADISLGEHIEPLVFQVLRYASGMSRGIYHKDVNKKYNGTFYYYDIGSDIYLLSKKTLVANNKVDALSKMYPEKSLEEIPLLEDSFLKHINKKSYINVDPELFQDPEKWYAEEDFLDQPLCLLARELGYDCIILLKMAGKKRLVTEVLDVRDRVESFSNLYKYM